MIAYFPLLDNDKTNACKLWGKIIVFCSRYTLKKNNIIFQMQH